MFNISVVSGQLCGDPEISSSGDDNPEVVFQLAISQRRQHVGRVTVHCAGWLAGVAATHLRRGDRVVVVGFLVIDPRKPRKRRWRGGPELVAIDLDLLQGDFRGLAPEPARP